MGILCKKMCILFKQMRILYKQMRILCKNMCILCKQYLFYVKTTEDLNHQNQSLDKNWGSHLKNAP